MATQYVDINGSRIASHDGVDQSGADDANVTDWYRDLDILYCHTIYTSKGPLVRQFKLQYENTTDNPGTWNDVGDGTGEIRFDNVDTVIPTDDYVITVGYRICALVGGYSWQNGIANIEDNTILDSGGYTLNDEYYTEFQWALNIGNTTLGKQYSFRLFDITMTHAHATFGAQLTINATDIEATGVRLYGEETGGSPDYRYEWTPWVNYPAGTAPTINNGNYGQIEGDSVSSPVMRVGGADFIRILDNYYGSTTTGEYKIYYRGYPSIFPWNASSASVPWVEYVKSTEHPQGHVVRDTDSFYQMMIMETSGSETGIGNQNCWISNSYNLIGQLETTYPYQVTCAINGDGLALVAGFGNFAAPFGLNGTYYSYSFRSVLSPGGRTWQKVISAIGLTSAWLDSESYIWVGAQNTHGFLGQNDTVERTTSLCSPVANNGDFVQVHADSRCIMGLKGDGSAWVWGYPYMIGDGRAYTGSDALTPTSVSGGHTFTSIWSSGGTAHGIDTDGQVWSWGANSYLSCGRGGPYNATSYVSYYSTPVNPIGDHKVCSVMWEGNKTWLLDENGNIFWLGYDTDRYAEEGSIVGAGNLMDFGFDPASLVSISFLPSYTFSDMGMGGALDTGGQIWIWGQSRYGQLGRNYCHASTETPSVIMAGSKWRAYWRCNELLQFALRDDNTMWGWGLNYYYGIGANSNNDCWSPKETAGLKGWS